MNRSATAHTKNIHTSTVASPNLHVALVLLAQSGGHFTYCRDVAQAVAAEGVAVSFICGEQVGPVIINGVDVLDVMPGFQPRSRFATPVGWALNRARLHLTRPWRLARLLRARRFDVVHFEEFGGVSLALMLLAARAARTPVVLTVHNLEPHEGGGLRRLDQRLANWLTRFGDRVIAHTPTQIPALERMGVSPAALHIIPHPLFETTITPNAITPAGPTATASKVVMFGVIRANKGVDTFVEAVERVGCDAVLVGEASDDYREHMRDLVTPANVTRIDRYLTDPELDELLGAGDVRVAVFPYLRLAAQSGAIHLALTHGIPIIVTRVGGLADAIDAFGCGVAIAPDSVDELCGALRQAFDDATYSRWLAGVDMTRDNLTVDRFGAATADAYTKAAHR